MYRAYLRECDWHTSARLEEEMFTISPDSFDSICELPEVESTTDDHKLTEV
ncbi:hypothetical protein BgiMline_012597, partial [Biomphalaria glabrata]